jgi:RHS repeat-associated protein
MRRSITTLVSVALLVCASSVGYAGRYYDARVARWTTPDPALEQKNGNELAQIQDGLPLRVTPYSYAFDNPTKYIDPDGRMPLVAPIAGVGAGVYVGGAVTIAIAGHLWNYATSPAYRHAVDRGSASVQRVAAEAFGSSVEGIKRALQATSNFFGNLSSDTPVPEDAEGGEANTNPYKGPVTQPVTIVDGQGNAIPVAIGEQVGGTADGSWIQVKDAKGEPTGVRKDGAHNPETHQDPRAQKPHGHRPDIRNPDGTPWLPVNH